MTLEEGMDEALVMQGPPDRFLFKAYVEMRLPNVYVRPSLIFALLGELLGDLPYR